MSKFFSKQIKETIQIWLSIIYLFELKEKSVFILVKLYHRYLYIINFILISHILFNYVIKDYI